MASQETVTDGQDCCNKIICTPKTHISLNILAKSAKGNYQTYRAVEFGSLVNIRDKINLETSENAFLGKTDLIDTVEIRW